MVPLFRNWTQKSIRPSLAVNQINARNFALPRSWCPIIRTALFIDSTIMDYSNVLCRKKPSVTVSQSFNTKAPFNITLRKIPLCNEEPKHLQHPIYGKSYLKHAHGTNSLLFAVLRSKSGSEDLLKWSADDMGKNTKRLTDGLACAGLVRSSSWGPSAVVGDSRWYDSMPQSIAFYHSNSLFFRVFQLTILQLIIFCLLFISLLLGRCFLVATETRCCKFYGCKS